MTPAVAAGLTKSTVKMSTPVAVIDACRERDAQPPTLVAVSNWVITRAVFYSVGSGVAAEAEPALGILGRDGGERRAELDVERI